MNRKANKEFWQAQTSSLHRADDPTFYGRKAREHAALMTPYERSRPCLDLGCGAGELLEHLRTDVNVVAGLDFSASMLAVARERLSGSGIRLANDDIFEYLPNASEPTWMTTGAINQYLDIAHLRRFLKIFNENPAARSLFMFDCVDPMRYSILPFGIGYVTARQPKRTAIRTMIWPAFWRVRRAIVGMKLALGILGRPKAALGGIGMGYGYTPSQWRQLIEPLGLTCDIVSSLLYEYRFHVIVRK
jgi:SAM-dependent methyltransferase